MDSELLTSILVAVGSPIALCLVILLIEDNRDKIKAVSKKAKNTITDTVDRINNTKTVEYQERLLQLLKEGYTEAQAKAMLKTEKKIEQMKNRAIQNNNTPSYETNNHHCYNCAPIERLTLRPERK